MRRPTRSDQIPPPIRNAPPTSWLAASTSAARLRRDPARVVQEEHDEADEAELGDADEHAADRQRPEPAVAQRRGARARRALLDDAARGVRRTSAPTAAPTRNATADRDQRGAHAVGRRRAAAAGSPSTRRRSGSRSGGRPCASPRSRGENQAITERPVPELTTAPEAPATTISTTSARELRRERSREHAPRRRRAARRATARRSPVRSVTTPHGNSVSTMPMLALASSTPVWPSPRS